MDVEALGTAGPTMHSRVELANAVPDVGGRPSHPEQLSAEHGVTTEHGADTGTDAWAQRHPNPDVPDVPDVPDEAVAIVEHPDGSTEIGIDCSKLPKRQRDRRRRPRGSDQDARLAAEAAEAFATLRLQQAEYFHASVLRQRRIIYYVLLVIDALFFAASLLAQLVRGGLSSLKRDGMSLTSGFSIHWWLNPMGLSLEELAIGLVSDFIGSVAGIKENTHVLGLFLLLQTMTTVFVSLRSFSLFLLFRLAQLAATVLLRAAMFHYLKLVQPAERLPSSQLGGSAWMGLKSMLLTFSGFFGILCGMDAAAASEGGAHDQQLPMQAQQQHQQQQELREPQATTAGPEGTEAAVQQPQAGSGRNNQLQPSAATQPAAEREGHQEVPPAAALQVASAAVGPGQRQRGEDAMPAPAAVAASVAALSGAGGGPQALSGVAAASAGPPPVAAGLGHNTPVVPAGARPAAAAGEPASQYAPGHRGHPPGLEASPLADSRRGELQMEQRTSPGRDGAERGCGESFAASNQLGRGVAPSGVLQMASQGTQQLQQQQPLQLQLQLQAELQHLQRLHYQQQQRRSLEQQQQQRGSLELQPNGQGLWTGHSHSALPLASDPVRLQQAVAPSSGPAGAASAGTAGGACPGVSFGLPGPQGGSGLVATAAGGMTSMHVGLQLDHAHAGASTTLSGQQMPQQQWQQYDNWLHEDALTPDGLAGSRSLQAQRHTPPPATVLGASSLPLRRPSNTAATGTTGSEQPQERGSSQRPPSFLRLLRYRLGLSRRPTRVHSPRPAVQELASSGNATRAAAASPWPQGAATGVDSAAAPAVPLPPQLWRQGCNDQTQAYGTTHGLQAPSDGHVGLSVATRMALRYNPIYGLSSGGGDGSGSDAAPQGGHAPAASSGPEAWLAGSTGAGALPPEPGARSVGAEPHSSLLGGEMSADSRPPFGPTTHEIHSLHLSASSAFQLSSAQPIGERRDRAADGSAAPYQGLAAPRFSPTSIVTLEQRRSLRSQGSAVPATAAVPVATLAASVAAGHSSAPVLSAAVQAALLEARRLQRRAAESRSKQQLQQQLQQQQEGLLSQAASVPTVQRARHAAHQPARQPQQQPQQQWQGFAPAAPGSWPIAAPLLVASPTAGAVRAEVPATGVAAAAAAAALPFSRPPKRQPAVKGAVGESVRSGPQDSGHSHGRAPVAQPAPFRTPPDPLPLSPQPPAFHNATPLASHPGMQFPVGSVERDATPTCNSGPVINGEASVGPRRCTLTSHPVPPPVAAGVDEWIAGSAAAACRTEQEAETAVTGTTRAAAVSAAAGAGAAAAQQAHTQVRAGCGSMPPRPPPSGFPVSELARVPAGGRTPVSATGTGASKEPAPVRHVRAQQGPREPDGDTITPHGRVPVRHADVGAQGGAVTSGARRAAVRIRAADVLRDLSPERR